MIIHNNYAPQSTEHGWSPTAYDFDEPNCVIVPTGKIGSVSYIVSAESGGHGIECEQVGDRLHDRPYARR